MARSTAVEISSCSLAERCGLVSRVVVQALSRPVNVVMGFADPSITLEELREVGVRRVSIGGGLSRLALRAFLDARAR
jgi:2-methylisocitrate lyase-like PEP mutase family enzyme